MPLTNNDKWKQYAELLLGIKHGGGKGYHYKKQLVCCFTADVRLTPCIKIKKSGGEHVPLRASVQKRENQALSAVTHQCASLVIH